VAVISDSNNPWLSRPTEPQVSAAAVTEELNPRPTGPQTPQRGVPAPDHVDRLPSYDQPQPADLWWLGVHGGAGESSLAALVPGWPAAKHGWPRPLGTTPARVVLTARSNMRGLRAAQSAATQWAAGLVPHVEVIGLVIVADAPGRIPRPLRDFAHVVSGGLPRVWNVPWIESWRLEETPTLENSPREVRRLVSDLQAILNPDPPSIST
jgi:hypothetical protein